MVGGKLRGTAAVVALLAAWPIVNAVKADWEVERAMKAAETRKKIQEYREMREELGISNPFPPKSMLEKQDAKARRLGGGRNVFEGAVSSLGPTHMNVEFTHHGMERCRSTVRGLARHKEVSIVINKRSAHRTDAWRLCGSGANHIRATRG